MAQGNVCNKVKEEKEENIDEIGPDFIPLKKEENIDEIGPDFIPLSKLNLTNVPNGFDPKHVKIGVLKLGKLIVKIVVKQTSPKRPKTYPDSEIKYPRGTIKGTGRIDFSMHQTDENIKIVTSTSVVFDESELQHTTCILNYDAEDSEIIELKCTRVARDIDRDRSEIFCKTDDYDLRKKLRDDIYSFDKWHTEMTEIYSNTNESKLAFTVSHPNGGPKYVCVGTYLEKEITSRYYDRVDTKCKYEFNLGQGCCGAPIYTFFKVTAMSLHPHSHMEKDYGVSAVEYERKEKCFFPNLEACRKL